MTAIQALAGLAGLVVLLWPALPAAVEWVRVNLQATGPVSPPVRPVAPDEPAAWPSYHDALLALSAVRARLVATDTLGDDQKRAVEVLTLALVQGGDQ